MKKRNLFNELIEGLDALKSEREGKVPLHRKQISNQKESSGHQKHVTPSKPLKDPKPLI